MDHSGWNAFLDVYKDLRDRYVDLTVFTDQILNGFNQEDHETQKLKKRLEEIKHGKGISISES